MNAYLVHFCSVCLCRTASSSDKQNLSLSFLLFCLAVCWPQTPQDPLCFFHQSIRNSRNMTNMGEVLGCEFLLEASMVHVWTMKGGFWFCSFFFFPPQRLIVRGIFYMSFYSLDAKGQISDPCSRACHSELLVQGSYKHKIANNSFCFGNRPAILLKI